MRTITLTLTDNGTADSEVNLLDEALRVMVAVTTARTPANAVDASGVYRRAETLRAIRTRFADERVRTVAAERAARETARKAIQADERALRRGERARGAVDWAFLRFVGFVGLVGTTAAVLGQYAQHYQWLS